MIHDKEYNQGQNTRKTHCKANHYQALLQLQLLSVHIEELQP